MMGKIGAEVFGVVSSAWVGILAVGESSVLTTSAIVATLGFAGLLVRQVMTAQQAVWQIARAFEERAESAEDREHYVRWQMESLRYRHGERVDDPGPYIPRRPAGATA